MFDKVDKAWIDYKELPNIEPFPKLKFINMEDGEEYILHSEFKTFSASNTSINFELQSNQETALHSILISEFDLQRILFSTVKQLDQDHSLRICTHPIMIEIQNKAINELKSLIGPKLLISKDEIHKFSGGLGLISLPNAEGYIGTFENMEGYLSEDELLSIKSSSVIPLDMNIKDTVTKYEFLYISIEDNKIYKFKSKRKNYNELKAQSNEFYEMNIELSGMEIEEIVDNSPIYQLAKTQLSYGSYDQLDFQEIREKRYEVLDSMQSVAKKQKIINEFSDIVF